MKGIFQSYRKYKDITDRKLVLPRFLWNWIDVKINSFIPKAYPFREVVLYFLKYLSGTPEIYPYLPSELSGYLYDGHIHSIGSDGRNKLKEIVEYISKVKYKGRWLLDGISLSDHSLDPQHEIVKTFKGYGNEKIIRDSYKFAEIIKEYKQMGKLPEHFITFNGSGEFNTGHFEDEDSWHREILVYGVPENFVEKLGGCANKIVFMQPVEFIEKVHDDNGIAILAHPFAPPGIHDNLEAWRKADGIESINAVSGMPCDAMVAENLYRLLNRETKYPKVLKDGSKIIKNLLLIIGYINWISERLAKKWNVPVVGNSDGHDLALMGCGVTRVKEPFESLEDFRNALKKRKTEAVFNTRWHFGRDREEAIEAMILDVQLTLEKWGPKVIYNPKMNILIRLLSKILSFAVKTHNLNAKKFR
ncbi:MAG: PHP-associated domain-containing protein [Candidatus Hodarchaeota archaeon]